MQKPKHAWMIRAGNDNELADIVQEENCVAIGWSDMGDLSNLKTREAFKQRYREAYPEDSEGRLNVNAGQIYRFVREIQEGDYVLTYIKASREILIGVAGPYQYREEAYLEHYPHVRPVEWCSVVSRDDFGVRARNSMGSTLTVFNLDDYLEQIHRLAVGEAPIIEEEEEETPPFYEEIKAQSDELIADLISHLDPYDFQDLVAALLRAMGYRAVSTTPGPDRGVDIIAHPDALGFERPRIKARSSTVQVPAAARICAPSSPPCGRTKTAFLSRPAASPATRRSRRAVRGNRSLCWIVMASSGSCWSTTRSWSRSTRPRYR